jgi:hypothetical protein
VVEHAEEEHDVERRAERVRLISSTGMSRICTRLPSVRQANSKLPRASLPGQFHTQ